MADSVFTPHGRHLIAGDWVAGAATFRSEPAHGVAHDFAVGTPDLVDRACAAAEDAFWSYGYSSRKDRAAFLNAIADEIEARGDAITGIGTSETGLPEARLQGERGRTTGQLRLFASHILKGDYLDRRHDPALPDRQPLPRPDLKLVQRPIGPVAVFGASNFPLAFSTAGGDTAAALAAGCPVVVKGHSAHPGTGEIVAEAIHAAIKKCGVHPGVFSLIQGGKRDVGQALVQHPLIRAVGFTGSLAGGRALFDLCCSRPDPIPFFGELGSVNPMFLLPSALAQRGAEIAKGWAASLTMGAGQFCTNPGIAVVIDGAEADAFTTAATEALSPVGAQVMLTDGIATAYRQGRDRIAATAGVQAVLTSVCDLRSATPYLYATTGAAWLANHALGEEVFGPLGLIVRVADAAEMEAVARSLQGQLTCTLHLDAGDTALGQRLIPVLERKAGRVLANGFPTGVEVANAMVHGGPYPASTNFGATSVGTLSIRRFLRPVCYQNIPDALLPGDLGVVMVKPDWIAVDWGTSRLRAWAMAADGAVLAEGSSADGMGALDADGFEPALMRLVGGWLPEGGAPVPVIACGMVGARQGWREAPYRTVPCAPLGGGMAATTADPRLLVRILPGLAQTTPPDVMRGEETQIAGLLSHMADFDGVICLPGTHTKWAQVSAGEVVSFQTFLTGEMFDLLATRSVLRHSVGGGALDRAAFAGAVTDAMTAPQKLAARLFAIRAAGLLEGLPEAEARGRLSGLLIGLELAGAKPYWLGQNVAVIGAPDLAGLYAEALKGAGVTVAVLEATSMTLAGLGAARRGRGDA